MQLFTEKVLDQYIVGTDPVYTPAELSELLGGADFHCGGGSTEQVPNTTTTLSITWQTSPDGARWIDLSTLGPGLLPQNFAPLQATYLNVDAKLMYVRVRFKLGGPSPACRLRFFIAGND